MHKIKQKINLLIVCGVSLIPLNRLLINFDCPPICVWFIFDEPTIKFPLNVFWCQMQNIFKTWLWLIMDSLKSQKNVPTNFYVFFLLNDINTRLIGFYWCLLLYCQGLPRQFSLIYAKLLLINWILICYPWDVC